MKKNKLLYLVSERYKQLFDEKERREEENQRQEKVDEDLRGRFGIEEVISAHAPENGYFWEGVMSRVGMGPAYDTVKVIFTDKYEITITHVGHELRGFCGCDRIGYHINVAYRETAIHDDGYTKEAKLFCRERKDGEELAKRMSLVYNFIHAARKEGLDKYRTVNPLVEVGLYIVSRLS